MIDSEEVKSKIRDRLYKLREDRNWSRRELSEKSEVTQRTIQRIESYDYYFSPSLSTLIDLANAFGITLSELFEGL